MNSYNNVRIKPDEVIKVHLTENENVCKLGWTLENLTAKILLKIKTLGRK